MIDRRGPRSEVNKVVGMSSGEDEAKGSIEYTIERNVVILDMRGRYTVLQFGERLREALADSAFVPPMRLLMDCRLAKINPSVGELQSAVETFATIREHFDRNVQIVVTSTLHYGLTRISAAFAELRGVHLDVHRDIESARAAAGLDQAAP